MTDRAAARPRPQRRPASIAGRLALWGALSVAAFLAVMGAILIGFSARAADEAYDRLLLASALSIADAIRIVDGEIIVDVPTAAFSMLAIGKADRVFHRLSDDRGRTITGYPDLATDLQFPRGADVAFENGSFRGFAVRIAANRRLITVAGTPRWVTVAIAETRESRAALAGSIRLYAVVPLILVGLAAVVMIPFSIGQALRPVAALGGLLGSREPGDLTPLPAGPVPLEVAPLVASLDHFVARLRTTLERNRDFLAEAAHQIRTPLASLRAMTEVAAEETDPAALKDQLARIHRNAVVAARITNQLLADASIANRLTIGGRERLRLDALAVAVVNDALDVSIGRSLRLDIADAAEGATVEGDPVALGEALRNLVDNAIAHGGADRPVDVSVDLGPDGTAVLAVADRGPGILDADKARVFGRFERGAGAKPGGSGLGLAIVARVAAAHGGSVRLTDRPGGGLVAEIRLPAEPGEMPRP